MEDLYRQLLEGVYAEGSAPLPGYERRTEMVVMKVVDLYAGPTFKAGLHIWTAAAADPQLRSRILPLQAKLGRAAHQMVVAQLGVDDTDPRVRSLIQATLDLARGLGLADLLHDDSKRRRQIVHAWAQQLDTGLHAVRG